MAVLLNAIIRTENGPVRRRPFGFRDWLRVVGRVAAGVSEKKMSLISAGVAFFAMLALFPAITAVISIFGYFADPVAVRDGLEIIRPILPDAVTGLVEGQIDTLLRAGGGTLGLASAVSLFVAIWSARAGITAMISGLEHIGGRPESRNLLWNLAVAYMLTLLLIIVTLVALSSVVIVPAIIAFFPPTGLNAVILGLVRWSVALLAVAVGIGALYRYGPATEGRRVPMLTLGSLVALLLWVATSAALSIYLGNFANYNEVYGSLGAVIALLMWFYLSAFVVLLGAELNARIEQYGLRMSQPVPGEAASE